MADNIYLPAGRKAGMPNLSDREPAFVRDEKAFYIGTPTGNLKLCEAGTLDKVAELVETVEGLAEELAALGETGEGQGEALKGIRTELDELAETQQTQAETLEGLTSDVSSHTETLATHTETLGTHTETLASHTESLDALQTEVAGKLSATAAETLAELTGEEELAAVISAYNSLIAALKACGIMSSEGVENNGQNN